MTEEATRQVRDAAARLAVDVDGLTFSAPVTHVYNPLSYAWAAHEEYLLRYAGPPARVVLVGMNPGPWGMAQTGVPFGEVAAVRDWLGIRSPVERPRQEHPKRPVAGLDSGRSEVSGRRLWSLFRERFGTPEAFFAEHFVSNYCPLLFLEDSGRNRTPDKLRAAERGALFEACDAHLRAVVDALEPEWVIGVGGFAESRIRAALGPGDSTAGSPKSRAAAEPRAPKSRAAAEPRGAAAEAGARGPAGPKVGRILHPSPASPRANRGWAAAATEELIALGVWHRPGVG